MDRSKVGGVLRQSAGILVGSVVYGIALSWFLIPYKIAPGGIGGLAQIFYHLFGWSPGIAMVVMNIPLWIFGLMFIGRQFGIMTFVGFFTSSIMTDLVSPHVLYRFAPFRALIERYNTVDGVLKPAAEWAMTDEIFLAAIAGSMLLGVGVGLIFRSKANTGGTDIPVAAMKKYLGISIGTGYLIVDTLIIFSIGLIFRELNVVIWGVFGLYLTSRFADIVTEGLPMTKAATIVCSSRDAEERIVKRINREMDRGATYLHGEGTYSGEPKRVIYVTFNIRQLARIRGIVREEDDRVFLVVNDVHDVLGYGFKSRVMEID